MTEHRGVVVYSFTPRSARMRPLGGLAGQRAEPGAVVVRLTDGRVRRLRTDPGQHFKVGDPVIVTVFVGDIEDGKNRSELKKVAE